MTDTLFQRDEYSGAFRVTPRARATDPATSHEAASSHRANAEAHASEVYDVVRCHRGLTYREIATHIDRFDSTECMRRLNDLEHKGLVVKGEARACSTNGHRMVTWWKKGNP